MAPRALHMEIIGPRIERFPWALKTGALVEDWKWTLVYLEDGPWTVPLVPEVWVIDC